jgi:hypothetical protein
LEWVRPLLLSVLILPFIALAIRDGRMHGNLRQVPRLERVLHGLLAVSILGLVLGVFGKHEALTLCGLSLFALVGGLDEFVYHRGIPAEETDTHAKEHLLLMLFLAVGLWTWRVAQ